MEVIHVESLCTRNDGGYKENELVGTAPASSLLGLLLKMPLVKILESLCG
jgi:hypothetical protein